MEIGALRKAALEAVAAARNREELERVRVKYTGRQSELSLALRGLKDMPLAERKRRGPELQGLRGELELLIATREKSFGTAGPRVDFTAPGRKVARGHLHPLTLIDREIRRIFVGLNFSVVEGPEVESEYYNFDALNIPPKHPARDAWDTFWLKSERKTHRPKDMTLLRTHTSPMQVRYMEAHKPPFQIIVPGRTFRYEATDASHEINFHQIEGLMVGKDVNLANFKFVMEEFFRRFFGTKLQFRYRPSYFPFVEPGIELDVKFRGKWLEMMGAGMVHPRVFEYAHYNPRDWQGFAFGMGMERLAMIKYGIPDVRLFYSGDLRFIRQF